MMSLRGFHFVFIIASIALAVMVTMWGVGMYLSDRGGVGHLVFAVGSLASAVAMTAYLVGFVRKARRIGME